MAGGAPTSVAPSSLEQLHAHRVTDYDSHQFKFQLIPFPFRMCFLFLKTVKDWPEANKTF